MAIRWWSDDDQLLAALGDAQRTARDVPPDFVEAGKAAFAWRDIDAELAALTYDSARDTEREPAVSRAELALLRYLTFASEQVTIELEVTRDTVLGQIVPPQSGVLKVHVRDGEPVTAVIDEIGCFVLRPVPSGQFRLHCHLAGADVVTDWFTL
jgi:hypothetical protein